MRYVPLFSPPTVDYLRATAPGPALRIEETASGPVVSEVPGALEPWLGLFSDQVDRGTPAPNPDEPPAAPEGASDPVMLEPHNGFDPTLLPRPLAEPPAPIQDPPAGPRERRNGPPKL